MKIRSALFGVGGGSVAGSSLVRWGFRLGVGIVCLWAFSGMGDGTCMWSLAPGIAHAASGSDSTTHGVSSDGGGGTDHGTARQGEGQGPTAGELVKSDLVTFDALDLVADVVADFKARKEDGDLPGVIYVVDSSGEYLGSLTPTQLLMAAPETVLDLMLEGDPVAVAAGAGVNEIAELAEKHHLALLPVTDDHDRFLGVVDISGLPVAEAAPDSGPAHSAGEAETDHGADELPAHKDGAHGDGHVANSDTDGAHAVGHENKTESVASAEHEETADTHTAAATHGVAVSHGKTGADGDGHGESHEEDDAAHGTAGGAADAHGPGDAPGADAHGTGDAHSDPHGADAEPKAKGVPFVEACISPLEYELRDRFYGWRPNDILDFSDNVNNFQLGVLEVSRRTVVILAERISRTGAIEAFDENVENAMNWLMIKSNRYWLPSPEAKYRAAMDELKEYVKRLDRGEAGFYNRTDNLIPLLAAYEDLLGSCEENLVKHLEEDGSPVSYFKADDYFFYAQGVASAMGTILAAVHKDFHDVLVARNGLEVLHHAVESCHHATEINPWLITDSGYSGIFANHRANLAAPISHARFYIGVLIKTLST